MKSRSRSIIVRRWIRLQNISMKSPTPTSSNKFQNSVILHYSFSTRKLMFTMAWNFFNFICNSSSNVYLCQLYSIKEFCFKICIDSRMTIKTVLPLHKMSKKPLSTTDKEKYNRLQYISITFLHFKKTENFFSFLFFFIFLLFLNTCTFFLPSYFYSYYSCYPPCLISLSPHLLISTSLSSCIMILVWLKV